MANRPRLVTAAKVLVYVNGRLFGRCTSFSWSSDTPRKEIRTVDIPHPVELAPTTTGVRWNMGVLRTVGDGGIQGAGMIATQQSDISREKYFTLLLVERSSNLVLFKADMCNTSSENWGINAKAIVSGQVSGSGIVWGNEASK